jgi:type II secretory pathway component PulK
MKTALRPQSGGMALILAMIAVFVFSAMAAGFALSMKVEARLAQAADAEQRLLWAGRSGVEMAAWILAQPPQPNQPFDCLYQVWAGGSGGPGSSNSPFSSLSLDQIQLDDDTWFERPVIEDLDRKININTATPDVIKQALTSMGVDANEMSVVSDSIVDWIDGNDLPQGAGAESDYYQGLPLPYFAKNAPIDDIAELLLIKGVTREMYEGSNASNHIASAFEHKLGFGRAPGQPPDYPFGLKDIFTPISSGRVNLNTADPKVLQVLLGQNYANLAEEIIKARAGPDGTDGTDDDIPFRNIGDLSRAGVTGPAAQQLTSLGAVRSMVFQVHVRAHFLDLPARDFFAILYRNSPMDIRIVSFYWE